MLTSQLIVTLFSGEEKLNILEIVKPVETVEVVIDPDAAGEEGALVEDGQLIAVERSGLSDEASEQVTRWAAALEGYRKEQVRLGIPYGEKYECAVWKKMAKQTWSSVYEPRLGLSRSCPLVS